MLVSKPGMSSLDRGRSTSSSVSARNSDGRGDGSCFSTFSKRFAVKRTDPINPLHFQQKTSSIVLKQDSHLSNVFIIEHPTDTFAEFFQPSPLLSTNSIITHTCS